MAPKRKGKKRNWKRKQSVARSLTAFPKVNQIMMRYCSQDVITLPVAGVSYHQYNCNNINDPDRTGLGSRAMGHDQWAQFYNHYAVKSAKITVHIATTGGEPFLCGLSVSDDATISTLLTTLTEQGDTTYKVRNGFDEAFTLTKTFDASKFFGIGNVLTSGDKYTSLFYASPSEQAVFNVYGSLLNPLAGPVALRIYTTIDYTVLLSEPKELVAS